MIRDFQRRHKRFSEQSVFNIKTMHPEALSSLEPCTRVVVEGVLCMRWMRATRSHEEDEEADGNEGGGGRRKARPIRMWPKAIRRKSV